MFSQVLEEPNSGSWGYLEKRREHVSSLLRSVCNWAKTQVELKRGGGSGDGE